MGVAVFSALITYVSTKAENRRAYESYQFHPPRRLMIVSLALFVVLTSQLFLNQSIAEQSDKRPLNEISKNGMYSFIHAYVNNEISYTDFYQTKDLNENITKLKTVLPGVNISAEEGLRQMVSPTEAEKRLNVVMVVMESMSAKFMNSYGSQQNITPVLDRLTNEGLFFSNVLATGTRTVRGLEALTLSVPPTPGQSIVRRPEGNGLYNLGSVFREKNYSTQFIYGGYSYFDNMKNFFAGNGFEILDQANMEKTEISFANAWGVCDEDIFNRVIREADRLTNKRTPFFQLVLTTSNHRPYTYPQKIDIPSGEGRHDAVKYADYAIGEFLKNAETKPWFKDTLFVFVSDHNAGVSGRLQIPLDDYTIPAIVYNPNIIKPAKYSQLASQIDIGPTILGLLNFSYENRFFGQDILRTQLSRAFVSNYQFVGLYKDNGLAILGPKKRVDRFRVNSLTDVTHLPDESPELKDLADETIAYYQSAAYFYKNKILKETSGKTTAASAK